MNTALSAFSTLAALSRPLLAWWQRPHTAAPEPIAPRVGLAPIAINNIAHHQRPTRPSTLKSITNQTPRPLRVVRILEAGQARAQVGRMVISGRMADVCAELDRLVAHEAAAA